MKKTELFAAATVLSCSCIASAQPCFEWQKITAPDGEAGDHFGVSIAMDGDALVVGARIENGGRGALYVYEWNGTSWAFIQKLIAPDGMPNDNLGHPVSIQGSTIVAGAIEADTAGASSGAAYVFERNGGTWLFAQKIAPSGIDAGDLFGYDISLKGNTLAIGALGDDLSGGRVDAGSVYIFNRVGSSWFPLQQVFAFDGLSLDQFGTSLDLDGTTLAIGARNDDHPGVVDGGSVYIFTLQGASWLFSRKIVAADVAGSDGFGGPSDSIDLDGDTLFVSAKGNDDQGTNRGAAYVFIRNGLEWDQVTKVYAANSSSSEEFGGRIRLVATRAVVGHEYWNASADNAGAVHVFQQTGGRWFDAARLEASDAAAFDSLGVTVDFNDRFIAAGAHLDDLASPARADAGSVYIYRLVDCLGLPDCNGNLIDDREDIATGFATDINDNLIPDSCEPGVCAVPGGGDANHDGMVNFSDIGAALANFGAMCP